MQAEIISLIILWLREHHYGQAAAKLEQESGIMVPEESNSTASQLVCVLQASSTMFESSMSVDEEVQAVSSQWNEMLEKDDKKKETDSICGVVFGEDSMLTVSQMCRFIVEGDASILPVIGSTYSCWSDVSTVLKHLFVLFLQSDDEGKRKLVSSIVWFVLVCNAPKELLNSLIGRFCNKITKLGFSKYAFELRQVLSRCSKEAVHATNKAWEDPQVPKNVFSHSLVLSDVPVVEVARQLTLLDFDLYKKIDNMEVLKLNWTTTEAAPNLSALLHRFTVIEQWVAGSILQEKDVNNCAKVLEYFVELAKCLLDMKSFSSCMAVMGGVLCDSVWKMKHLFSLLSSENREALQKLEAISNPFRGFQAFRELYENEKGAGPCIPFMQPYIQQVVIVCKTTKTFITNMVNVKKCFALHRILEAFVGNQFQFPFLKVEQVARFLKTDVLEKELLNITLE